MVAEEVDQAVDDFQNRNAARTRRQIVTSLDDSTGKHFITVYDTYILQIFVNFVCIEISTTFKHIITKIADLQGDDAASELNLPQVTNFI